MTEATVKSIASGDKLTPETFSDFVQRLNYHCQGEGVSDHCTADAIFIVERKRLITGIDLDYAPEKVICLDDHQWFSPKEYWDDCDRAQKPVVLPTVRTRDDYESRLGNGDVGPYNHGHLEGWNAAIVAAGGIVETEAE